MRTRGWPVWWIGLVQADQDRRGSPQESQPSTNFKHGSLAAPHPGRATYKAHEGMRLDRFAPMRYPVGNDNPHARLTILLAMPVVQRFEALWLSAARIRCPQHGAIIYCSAFGLSIPITEHGNPWAKTPTMVGRCSMPRKSSTFCVCNEGGWRVGRWRRLTDRPPRRRPPCARLWAFPENVEGSSMSKLLPAG